MPFLDTLVIPQSDGSLLTTVYRKPTHTKKYLQWDRYHAISAKYSVISTLFHRAKDVCSTKEQLEEHTHSEGPNIMQVPRMDPTQEEEEDQCSC